MRKIVLLLFLCTTCYVANAQKKSIPEIGIANTIENDSLLRSFGYQFLIESTTKFLSPRLVTDLQFEEKLAVIKHSRIPVYACNLFIPGDLKVVGPDVNEQAVLAYADIVLQRAQRAGL